MCVLHLVGSAQYVLQRDCSMEKHKHSRSSCGSTCPASSMPHWLMPNLEESAIKMQSHLQSSDHLRGIPSHWCCCPLFGRCPLMIRDLEGKSQTVFFQKRRYRPIRTYSIFLIFFDRLCCLPTFSTRLLPKRPSS